MSTSPERVDQITRDAMSATLRDGRNVFSRDELRHTVRTAVEAALAAPVTISAADVREYVNQRAEVGVADDAALTPREAQRITGLDDDALDAAIRSQIVAGGAFDVARDELLAAAAHRALTTSRVAA